MTEIETVTVTFEELQKDVKGYLQARKTRRLEITLDGEVIVVLGPWLPGEVRSPAPDWFRSELHPPLWPIHPEDPDFDAKSWEFLREHKTST
jgi:hypothetical protein